MKRRQFMKSAAVMLNAAAVGNLLGGQYRPRYPVTILPVSDYRKDVAKDIASILASDGPNLRGKKVLLKPNFVEAHPERPINTHIAVIANVADACLRLGASEVIVGEASGHRRDPWFSVLNPSLRAVLDKRVKCIDLNHGEIVIVANRGAQSTNPAFALAKPVVEADVLISLPKMKTHHWMGVTLSLKNLFGVLPGIFYGWPKNPLHLAGIEGSILDLARAVRIHYAVVDGIVGMEGDGPIMGVAKPVGALILSPQPLAADATAARIMGFDPNKVPYLAQAGKFLPGLSKTEVEYRGEQLKRFATRFDCLDQFKSMQGGFSL